MPRHYALLLSWTFVSLLMFPVAGCNDRSTMPTDEPTSVWQYTLGILWPKPPNTIGQLEALGAHFQAQGQMPLAERYYRQALTLREYAWGAEHPYVAPGLETLANFAAAQGKQAEADALRQRALAVRGNNPTQTQRTPHP